MGREIQKRKNRSSRPKVRMKARNHKKQVRGAILGNALVAEKWDKNLSLAQNYARLGVMRQLQPSNGHLLPASASASSGMGLPGATKAAASVFAIHNDPADSGYTSWAQRHRGAGGRQTIRTDGGEENEQGEGAGRGAHMSTNAGTSTRGVEEVKVRRDPVTGAILSILSPSNEDDNTATQTKTKQRRHREVQGPLASIASLDSDASDSEVDSDARHRYGHRQSRAQAQAQLHLLEQGLVADAPKKRTQSARERAWIEALIARHGPDGFEAMARDKKLNVRQQSAGDIKRRVKQFLASPNDTTTAFIAAER